MNITTDSLPLLKGLAATAAVTAVFAALDRAFTALHFQRAYYAVHVIHNAAIVALTAADVQEAFLAAEPAKTSSLPIAWSAVYCCYALHLYHTLLYWRSFRFDDWLHHILMICVTLPLGCAAPSGPLLGMSLFFTTGLPGGISYGALWLERNGWLSRQVEKSVNQRVNVWIRAPGCVATATLISQSVLVQPGAATSWQGVAGLVCALLVGWNGLYFMQQAVESGTQTRLLPRH
jgi:hypothetical protein